MTSQGVQTSPAAVQEQEAQAASPEWPQRKMDGGSQHQEYGAGTQVKKETRDAASSPLATQAAPAGATGSANPFQDYLEGNHAPELKQATTKGVEAP